MFCPYEMGKMIKYNENTLKTAKEPLSQFHLAWHLNLNILSFTGHIYRFDELHILTNCILKHTLF